MSENVRRLPVYILLDCSESMAGPAIEAVDHGMRTLIEELRSDPYALETAYLSVITFSREARQETPLTELMAFQLPRLRVRPGTALGAALRLLKERLENEVLKTTPTSKGDYRPLVFLLTDGQPTDDWEGAADELNRGGTRLAELVAIGCGPDVDIQVMYRITDSVLLMPDITPEAIRKFFVWLSSSVRSVSVSVGVAVDDGYPELPALPPDVEVPSPRRASPEGAGRAPRQIFLHGRCSTTRQPYLMRFVRREYEDRYDAVASHPLEELDDSDAELLPPVNSSSLIGCPPCPYCQNRRGGVCPCGALFCTPDNLTALECPRCEAYLGPGSSGEDFEVTRVQG